MTPTPATPPVEFKRPLPVTSILIRSWPKIVFLYPTFLAGTICWIASLFAKDGGLSLSPWVGNTFYLIFFLNLLVFCFDFSRIKSITLLFMIIAVVFGIAWANTKWGWVEDIKHFFSLIDVRMNTQAYGFFSGFLGFVLLLVLINSRFNYYEINHREILHHHGYLGDITRLPTQSMNFQKEIYDLLEYVLLRSGRLVLYPATQREAIILDNVVNVNRVEKYMKELLSVVAVQVQTPGERGRTEEMS